MPQVAEPAEPAGKLPGKGRPTPKRREAQQARRVPVAAPTSRWAAYKARRAEVGAERQVMRAALRSGDDRHLPARDRGPARSLVRDIVDSRRNSGGLLLLALLVSLATSGDRSPAVSSAVFLAFVFSIVVVAVDMTLLGRRVRRTVRERFGERESTGVAGYAAMRALQFRRWRLPPPKVRIGEKPG